MSLGYVVVEFNQSSGRPRVAFHGDLYDELVDALTDADGLLADLRQNNRLEKVGVARVEMESLSGEVSR